MSGLLRRYGHLATALFIASLAPLPEAGAATLSLSTPAQVDVGGTFELQLRIEGLGLLEAPALGAYLVEIAYDADAVSAGAVDFDDPVYSEQLALEDEAIYEFTSTPGLLRIAAISSDPPETLDGLQPPDFVLVRITMTGTAEGPSTMSLSMAELSDAQGNAIPVAAGATATIEVPEPAAVPLMAAGLALLGGATRLRARRSRAGI